MYLHSNDHVQVCYYNHVKGHSLKSRLTMVCTVDSSEGGPGNLTLNFSADEGSTFPLSGNPGAAFNCSLVGSSNASASAVFDEISGPVVISFSPWMVAVSSCLGAGVDFEAFLGEDVDKVRAFWSDLGMGGRSWDASAEDSLATRVVLTSSVLLPRHTNSSLRDSGTHLLPL